MRKLLITTFIILSLAIPMFTYAEEKCTVENKESKPNCEDKIHQLFEDITLLNLINGLNLTEEQIKQIIQYNKEIQLLKEQIEDKNNRKIGDMLNAFNELKSTLENNEGIPPGIERRAFAMEQEGKKIQEELMKSVSDIEKELTAILLEAQIEVINNFNPCLIPPQNLKNPVRAGQAQDNPMGLDMLRQIREIPKKIFDERKPEMIERHLEMIQKHIGKLNEEEKEQETRRFSETVEKARSMSDKEFELNGPDLARGFINESKKTLEKDKQLREEAEKIHQARRGGPSRLGRFLLNPRIMPILEKRLEIMKNPKKIAPADLDNIKPGNR